MYTGFVTIIKNLRPHPNADRFKVLEGICKDEATAPDMEEAQDA